MDAAALVSELRKMYEQAGTADGMPADTEVYSALIWAEKNVGILDEANDEVRRMAALERVLLWQYLREQIDRHQLQAVDQARSAGAEWAQLAGPLAVNAASAAYNKTQRMRTSTLTDGTPERRPVRRTPEAVAQAQRRIAAAERAERRRENEARRRHVLTARIARQLLDHRTALAQDAEVTDWLDEVAAVLPDCRTPTQQVSLATYTAAAVRALKQVEQRTARPAAATEEARLALAAATALLEQP
ncbi:hypothetical protein ABT010_40805 [Streptomyces sp. NPDC002668]|uniref:hypothetical protein n=1 Tax=Streptomyces sp. NPDC002668 TaxID=3154422 RepID=UPI00332DF618